MIFRYRAIGNLAVLTITLCIGAGVAVRATDVTLQGNTYIVDAANFVNTTSLTAGQPFVLDLLATDQATNATLGSVLGYCVPLRATGPSQCQYTVQLASGTLQASYPYVRTNM